MKQKKYSNCQNCGKPTEGGKFCSPACGELFFRKPEGPKPLMVKQDNDFKKALPVSAKILKEEEENKFKKITDGELNIRLIQLALKEKMEISVTPKRTHVVKGIPIRFDNNTYRIYIETERAIESVLLSSISHYIFSKKLFNLLLKEEER